MLKGNRWLTLISTPYRCGWCADDRPDESAFDSRYLSINFEYTAEGYSSFSLGCHKCGHKVVTYVWRFKWGWPPTVWDMNEHLAKFCLLLTSHDLTTHKMNAPYNTGELRG